MGGHLYRLSTYTGFQPIEQPFIVPLNNVRFAVLHQFTPLFMVVRIEMRLDLGLPQLG